MERQICSPLGARQAALGVPGQETALILSCDILGSSLSQEMPSWPAADKIKSSKEGYRVLMSNQSLYVKPVVSTTAYILCVQRNLYWFPHLFLASDTTDIFSEISQDLKSTVFWKKRNQQKCLATWRIRNQNKPFLPSLVQIPYLVKRRVKAKGNGVWHQTWGQVLNLFFCWGWTQGSQLDPCLSK